MARRSVVDPATRRPDRSAILAALALLLSTVPAAAQPDVGAFTRVRAVDQKAAWLLAKGLETSPALAMLVDELERSDLFVHLHAAPFRILRLPAHSGVMRFVASTPAGRYVRISINVPDCDINLIAALAHELQHAVEVAREPIVTDAAALRRFYEARGVRKADGSYCTREAVEIAARVRDEVVRHAVPAAARQ